jgi:UDP-N-acetylmuramyl-tripeptide synthetase
VKKRLKKLIPTWLLSPLLPVFHWFQSLGANIRYGFPARNMKVIAITGTNGKTTTAALLGKIIEQTGQKVAISTTAFYQVGAEYELNDTNMTVTDPFKLFQLLARFKKANVDWVILEVTSHALSQSRILGVPIHTAVMTNLTQDHLDYHKTMDAYAAAKARLFKKKPRNIILNRDDDWYQYYSKFTGTEQTLTYGTAEDADCRIMKAQLGPQHSKLELKLERSLIKPTINLVGKFNAYNAICAATIAHAIEVEPKLISSGLEATEFVPGRMETVKNKRGLRIVVDYAHTTDALENVLESLRGVTKRKIITVFGATGDRDTAKRPLMGGAVARLSDIAIITDDDPFTENPITIRAEVLAGAQAVVDGAEIYEIADRRSAIGKALELARRGDSILLAGIGHQQYRVIGEKKVPWSERSVVEEFLNKK